MNLNKQVINTLNEIIVELVKHLGQRASGITEEKKRKSLMEEDIKGALRDAFDHDIAQSAIMEGRIAVVNAEEAAKSKRAEKIAIGREETADNTNMVD